MRVYFVGAHSVGKTTLAEYVSRTWDLPKIDEVAREVAQELGLPLSGIRKNLDLLNSYQKKVFEAQVKKELEFGNRFVADRAFDSIPYWVEYGEGVSEFMQTSVYREYILNLKKKDCLIFFIRPFKELVAPDGFREDLSWESITRIDGMVKFMLKVEDFSYIEINEIDFEKRCGIVDNWIQKQLKVVENGEKK